MLPVFVLLLISLPRPDAYRAAGDIADETFSLLRIVHSCNAAKRRLAQYEEQLSTARKINIRKNVFTALILGTVFGCMYLILAYAFWLGATLIYHQVYNSYTGEPYSTGDVIAIFLRFHSLCFFLLLFTQHV
jgi:ABC-type bacteriocin/lantibiotic exporter with double-glycine peptidase domain